MGKRGASNDDVAGVKDGLVHPQHPFKILRKFMKGHPKLKMAATQQGFSQLVDCSQSLVRAVEQGQTKITPRLAKKIQAATGVPISWLSTLHNPKDPIPAASGGMLTHETTLATIDQEIDRNLEKAGRSLMTSSKNVADPPAIAVGPTLSPKRRIATALAKLTEEALFESLSRGETRMMDEITRILARDQSAEKPEVQAPGNGD